MNGKEGFHLTCIFSDDVRQEANGQTTVIGWYTGAAIRLGPVGGIVLPKFCITALIRIPQDQTVQSLKLEVRLDDVSLQAVDMPSHALQQMHAQAPNSPERGITLTVRLQLGNFTIPKEGILRLVAMVDGTELKGAGLRCTRLAEPGINIVAAGSIPT